jgi:hypothetical protein
MFSALASKFGIKDDDAESESEKEISPPVPVKVVKKKASPLASVKKMASALKLSPKSEVKPVPVAAAKVAAKKPAPIAVSPIKDDY